MLLVLGKHWNTSVKVGFYYDANHLGSWSWRDFLNGELPVSGTDTLNLSLPVELALRGLDVVVLTSNPGRDPPVTQLRFESESQAVSKSVAEKCDVLWFSARRLEETKRLLSNCEACQLPIVASVGNGPDRQTGEALYNSEMVRRVVCVSAVQADEHRHRKVFEKMSFVHHAITRQGVSSDKDPRKVCFVGAITQSKGFHNLAKAWPLIRRQVPDAELHVLGSAALYERGLELGPLGLGELGYEQRFLHPYLGDSPNAMRDIGVVAYGLLSPVQVDRLLAGSLVGVVNPNLTGSFETFCISAVDVSLNATAVVGADRLGLRETTVHHLTGERIKKPEELVSVVVALLNDPDRAIQYGQQGRQWVLKKFDREKIVRQWIRLLSESANGEASDGIPFSWQRATPRVVVKQVIRLCGLAG